MIVLVLAALQATPEALPEVTLAEALRRGVALDPSYVLASRDVRDATWQRTTAMTAFVLPAVSVQASAQRFSSEAFNIGTGELTDRIVSAQLSASYELFRGGGKLFILQQRRAELQAAEASETEARFRTAVLIEADYYDVLAEQELTRVATERVRRAEEQLAVARARVLSGAAVQTDSLQLRLELNRARVELLGQQSAVRVARLQLGRRIGMDGPVAAAPLGDTVMPDLPLTDAEAVAEALDASPAVLSARARVRAAAATARGAWSAFLPTATIAAQVSAFDDRFFPNATTRSSIGLTVSLPIWNNGQREIALSRARSAREVAAAARDDTERAIRRDVIEAYEAYLTARASGALADEAVVVARENLRVQEERYRAGATTIIDLVTAQVSMTEAEAGRVQARYATRLALAGLEAILGRRLFTATE